MSEEELEKRIVEIIQNLDSKGQFTGVEAIDEITGLYLLATSVLQHSIRVRGLVQEEEESKNIIEVLSRYPPYEPIPLESIHDKNVRIKGARIWFIKPKDFKPLELFKWLKDKFHSASDLVIRCYLPPPIIPSGMVIQDLEPVNVLEFYRGSITIHLYLRDRYHHFFIKYGSEKLKQLIGKGKDEEHIREQYRRETGKRYDPLNLTYVWYCRLGIGISTDPWDTKCPFQRYCIIGRERRRGCDGRRYWSWRRRIFPKIYLVRQGLVKGKERLLYELSPLIKIYGIYNAKVTVQSHYAMTQIGEIIFRPINIGFERPITYVLYNSNAIGIEFNMETIKSMLKAILMRDVNPAEGLSKTPKIRDVLMTKYFLYRHSSQGRNLIEVLESNGDRLLSKYEGFRRNISLDDLLEFSYQILLHTIAHTIYELILKDFELSEQHILYNYDTSTARVYVIENTRYGCLDTITQFRMKYNDIYGFRERYLEFIRSIINIHEHEIERFANELANEEKTFIQRVPELKDILDELRKYYNKPLMHGLVLDAVQFKIHIYESNYIADLAEKFKVDMKVLEDYLDHLVLLTIKLYCLDGCTSCIQLEKYCSELLAQPLITSRNLIREFMKIYLEEHDIIADYTLPESLLKRAQRTIIAVTPYMDHYYMDLLEKKSAEKVNIIIITNKDTVDSMRKYKLLKNTSLVTTEHRIHEKYYIIDDICLKTTWNMQLTKSTNAFTICTAKKTIEHVKSLFKQQYRVQVS